MTKEPEPSLEDQILQLSSQLKSMEGFANMVVEQRNAAQNESAQLKAQLINCLNKGNS